MRIGIDGRWFFSGNPSGKVMVRMFLGNLVGAHPEHDFFVFLKRGDRNCEFPLRSRNLHLHYLRGSNGLFFNTVFIPLRTRKLGLDACLFFYFSPLFGSGKKIVIINDITFLAFPRYFTWKEKIYFCPIRFLSRRADLVCTISRSEKERMLHFGFIAADKIAVVPLGVDASFLPLARHDPLRVRELKEKYRLPERFLLYVGRMNERKNILNLLKAVRTLKDRNVPLVLAGDADWKMFDLPGKIKELGLEDRVLLLGQVPAADLPALYALATVFCYVSFAEGFGLPPLEAMASDVPVVVSDRDSLPEVCGEAGTYVDPERPDEIALAIESLWQDADLRNRKREQGRQQAKLFSWQQSTERLLRIILDAVG